MSHTEILRATLRQPTARLSESEAADRLQDLKDRKLTYLGSSGRHHVGGPVFDEFRRDWQRMMVREDS